MRPKTMRHLGGAIGAMLALALLSSCNSNTTVTQGQPVPSTGPFRTMAPAGGLPTSQMLLRTRPSNQP